VSKEEFENQLNSHDITYRVIGGEIYLPLSSVDEWMDLVQACNYILGGEVFKKVGANFHGGEELFDYRQYIEQVADNVPQQIASDARQYFKELVSTYDSVVLALSK